VGRLVWEGWCGKAGVGRLVWEVGNKKGNYLSPLASKPSIDFYYYYRYYYYYGFYVIFLIIISFYFYFTARAIYYFIARTLASQLLEI
jgi:hypothetical protein